MSQDSAFTPYGPLTLIGTAVVQVASTTLVNPASYRIRCLVAGYLSWAPSTGSVPPTIGAPTAPTAGVPSVNTIGMSVGQTEVIALPPNAYFLSNNAAGFEVTAGEGI